MPYLAFYCFMNGIGCGTCYMVPLICGWEWFPDSKGLVTGCTLGGYGFGSFIFSQVSTKLVNPDHKDPDVQDPENPDITFYGPDVADRVPYMIQTLVYIWAVLVFIGVLLISRKPREVQDFSTSEEVMEENEDLAMAKDMEKLRSTTGTEDADMLKKNNQNQKLAHVQTPAISECSVSLLGTNDSECKLEIKSVKYFVYSIRFW